MKRSSLGELSIDMRKTVFLAGYDNGTHDEFNDFSAKSTNWPFLTPHHRTTGPRLIASPAVAADGAKTVKAPGPRAALDRAAVAVLVAVITGGATGAWTRSLVATAVALVAALFHD